MQQLCARGKNGGSAILLHFALAEAATICCKTLMAKIDPTMIAEAGGVSAAYARMMLAGTRKPSLPLALKIYDATGVQLGPIRELSRSQIDVARQMAA